ncbi:BMP family ABC transporter substrate-binding protein, partial [Ruminococcus sp.]|uniref:BMP family ABC transporter substrate-binding protein n=1 Tax=Ruminococcus sp. TaxID=41978 RepID=UPI00386C7AF4
AKIGYVGAYTYAEVKSGYTSFFLGARSICPTATMEVQFTGSWYDETLEKEAATTLINNGCVLISQHADSMGAPTACEDAGVPDVSYNGSTLASCPNTFIVSSRIDWTPYLEYAIKAAMNGDKIDADWTGTLGTKSVVLTEVNDKAAAKDTQAKIDEVKAKLDSGEIHVFDTKTFTVTVDEAKQLNVGAKVDGEGHLTSYMADVDTDEKFEGDTEVISDGYFHESEFRSAPYFALDIDGITLLNTKF